MPARRVAADDVAFGGIGGAVGVGADAVVARAAVDEHAGTERSGDAGGIQADGSCPATTLLLEPLSWMSTPSC